MAILKATLGQSGAENSGSQVQGNAINVPITGASVSNGDVVLLAPVSANLIPHKCTVVTTALTGATDVDLGFYEGDLAGNVVIDADALADGLSLAAASKTLDGLGAIPNADYGKSFKDLPNVTLDKGKTEMWLALTFNTAPSVDGTVTVLLESSQG